MTDKPAYHSNTPIGIDALSFYVPRYGLDLETLAKARGHKSDKYARDLGQRRMALPSPNEDIVTMAVGAAHPIITPQRADKIKLVLFATESAIDQAKAAGIYVHHYLGLRPDCRVVELKQACYSLTAALQFARAMITLEPGSEALIIGSDFAKYQQNTVAEPTQGAGAVAMLITENPSMVALDPYAGIYTRHVMDFWRPPYSRYALVSPQYSVRSYVQALEKAWTSYAENSGYTKDDIDTACYHTPFTRMAQNVHKRFRGDAARAHTETAPALLYGRDIGNTYTAALYIALSSLLENTPDDMAGKRIGFFSYGSGAVAEYFSGVVQTGYKAALRTKEHGTLLSDVQTCDMDTYHKFYDFAGPRDGETLIMPSYETGPLYIEKIEHHKRNYAWTHAQQHARGQPRISQNRKSKQTNTPMPARAVNSY